MSLSGSVGKRKKKKARISLQDDNIAVYEIVEPPNHQTKGTELQPQNVDHSGSHDSGSVDSDFLPRIRAIPAPKMLHLLDDNLVNLFENRSEDGATDTAKSKSVGPNRVSLNKNVGQTGRRISSGRQSGFIPSAQTGPAHGQRRVSSMLNPTDRFVPEAQPKKLYRVEEGQVRRSSAVQPMMEIGRDKKVRVSVAKPIEINAYSPPGRSSMVRPLDDTERFPLSTAHQPMVYAVRRSSVQPANRQSLLKRLLTKKNPAEEQEGRAMWSQPEQAVYAVPAVPTRGRTRSVLQQSVKTLSSQKEETPVAWKNIRRSMDTDVFSADTRQRNEPQPLSPGYVNMERGQGMLVSELLNPITSIFVSDLKNQVPKDPLTKPKELNNWNRPRQSQRLVVTPKQTPKTVQRVKVTEPVNKAAPKIQRKPTPKNYESEDESSSEYSDETVESYNPRNKYTPQKNATHHRVYAARMPDVILPDVRRETEENNESVADTTPASPLPSIHSITGDFEGEPRIRRLSQPPNVGRLSKAQQTDIADAVSFLCNPPKEILQDTTIAAGSGSKLRWRMDIKKEE